MSLKFKFEPVAWVAAADGFAKVVIAALTVFHVVTADQAAAATAGETTIAGALAFYVRSLVKPTAKIAAEREASAVTSSVSVASPTQSPSA